MQTLTAKQAMFVKEYLLDLNMTQAAIRAGYSAKTAEAAGSRLFRDVKIQAAIAEAMKERSERVKVSADDVAQELTHLGFSNIQDLFDEAGNLMDIRKLPRHVSASIKSVKINLTEACAVQEIQLWDKKGSLELLGKHLGMFSEKAKDDDNNIPPPTRVEIVVKDARKECQPPE